MKAIKTVKLKKITVNMRKKSFLVETKHLAYEFPFSRLEVVPAFEDPVVKLKPEPGFEGFTYTLKSGKEGYIIWDQVLDYNKDPDYEHDMLLFELTCRALDIIKQRKIKKREIARRLKTSPAHLYRLLDTTFYGKTIDQMIRLLRALDYHVEFILKDNFLKKAA